MITEQRIREETEKIFLNKSFSVNGIGLSFKIANGEKTNEKSITFMVEEKKPLDQLDPSEIIPSSVEIDGETFVTDVVVEKNIKLMACYATESDSEIQRLRGQPNLLTPFKGGQEIIMFPSDWQPSGGGYSFFLGTLGFFAVDNIDSRLVGVTNAHVVCSKKVIASDRASETAADTYNTIESANWIVDGTPYQPGALARNGSAISTTPRPVNNIKRYTPFSLTGPNYTDIALLIMDPSFIDNTSYRIHHPTTEVDYTTHMPFASTAEIDSLLTSNPYLYSVGRTTGPKGWGASTSCKLVVTGVGVNVNVDDPEIAPSTIPFNDVVAFQYEDGSSFPINSGDSGSVVVADFSGVRKIIGVAFAGGTTTGYMCRIDRVASEMSIREWDSGYVLDESVPLTPRTQVFPITSPNAALKTYVDGTDQFFQAGTTDSSSIP